MKDASDRGYKEGKVSAEQSYQPEGGLRPSDFAALYRRHWHEICAYLYAHFGAGPPEPEDMAQQAFAQYAALENKEAVENPKAFLIRVAHNLVISEKRRDQTRNKHVADLQWQNEGDDCSPERVFIAKEQITRVNRLIERMPKTRRRMLLLNRMQGLSYAEIARQFGVSATAVKKQVARAMQDLDKLLQEHRGS